MQISNLLHRPISLKLTIHLAIFCFLLSWGQPSRIKAETIQPDEISSAQKIHMAQKLDIKVIAEGIENVSQKNLLEQFNCNYGQGFLFARPDTLDQLLAHLNTSKNNINTRCL